MSNRKILLADDSMTIQKVVNLTFADEGIEVITVGDGDAAMLKFNELAPDLVLADVNMPGLDGYQICEAIKQNERTKRIPVILLVGSFEPFDEERAGQVGADGFLTKPFQSIRQLVNKVSELLEAQTDEDEFLRPIENPEEPVSSFGDILKAQPNDEFDTADDSIENLGDAGMDDEMIQTSQIGSLPVDEARKFESAPVYQSFAEDLDQPSPKPPSDAEVAADYPPAEDWAKTQPLSSADLDKFRAGFGEEKGAPDFDADEVDLLDFPRATNTEILQSSAQSAESEIFDENSDAADNAAEEIAETPDEISALAPEFSPELIDAIADRVAEKLTNRVIRRVVGEVLAQMERKK